MAKKMCKLNRRTIAASMGAVYSIVAEPKFVCRSCARSADKSANLCKPTPIPPKACRSANPSLEIVEECALVAEAKQTQTISEVKKPEKTVVEVKPSKPQIKRAERAVAKAKMKRTETAEVVELEPRINEKALKKQRKALKQQKKLYKKLKKLLKKEQKLTQKRAKLDAHLNEVFEASNVQTSSKHLH